MFGDSPDKAGCWAVTEPLWLEGQDPRNRIVFTGDWMGLWAKWEVQNLKKMFKRLKITWRDSRHAQSSSGA